MYINLRSHHYESRSRLVFYTYDLTISLRVNSDYNVLVIFKPSLPRLDTLFCLSRIIGYKVSSLPGSPF